MFQGNNFISFHDLTTEAHYLWVSPTVHDVLGYDPEDLIGRRAYEFVYPDDIADSKTVHKENLINDLVASQIVLRYKGKDGRAIHCACVFSLCYDFIVNCATLLEPGAESYVQLRAHSSAMTRFAGSKKEEFERIKRHHQAFEASSWNHQVMEPEARVCLIINRFTQSLIVMYASSACEKVFHVDPDHLTGRPLLLFVRADDLGSFVEQVEIIKTSSAITQMRFWFQSPNWPQEIPCEAIIFGAADGIVAVVRKCRPFIRKRFITSRDHFGTITRESSWSTSTWSRSRNSSPAASSVSPSPSPSPPNYGGFVSNGKTPSPIRDLPMSVLNQIRIVELNDEHLRPLTDIPEDDPSLVHEATAALEIPGFKEVILHDYDDGDDSSDDDYDDYDGVENVRRFKRMSISQKGHGP